MGGGHLIETLLFKGILVRYMTQLILCKGVAQGDKEKFILFLQNNAQTLWLKGTTRPGYFYSSNWTVAPTGETDLTTDESGAMLMDLLRAHPLTVMNGVLHENPFYTPADEMLAELRMRSPTN